MSDKRDLAEGFAHDPLEIRFAELWSDFLEGELGTEGLDELQQMLAKHEQLLKSAADSFEIHRLLGLETAESPERRDAFIRATMNSIPKRQSKFVDSVMQTLVSPTEHVPSEKKRKRFAHAVLVCACVALLSLFLMRWPSAPKAKIIARISGISGSVLWTGDGGLVANDLTLGRELNGGTLEGLGPNSWVELTFLDGTEVTLSGRSLLTFSGEHQKQLYLREGSITAEVLPQPTGHPMLIHTRSAELEVLGTQFSVEAELASTLLNVSDGLVRVKRLTDGRKVEVPAQHRLVMSAREELIPERQPNFVSSWRSRLELGPVDSIGQWVPSEGNSPARLKAIPFIFRPPGSSADERPITLYLAALPVSRGDSQPVMIQPQTVFRLRGRAERTIQAFFGFQVNRADGSFAGKFLASQEISPESIGKVGRFELVFGVDDFQLDPALTKLKERLPGSPSGLVISSCWCFTLQPCELELESVTLFADD